VQQFCVFAHFILLDPVRANCRNRLRRACRVGAGVLAEIRRPATRESTGYQFKIGSSIFCSGNYDFRGAIAGVLLAAFATPAAAFAIGNTTEGFASLRYLPSAQPVAVACFQADFRIVKIVR
jgi:hypothetical protein